MFWCSVDTGGPDIDGCLWWCSEMGPAVEVLEQGVQ